MLICNALQDNVSFMFMRILHILPFTTPTLLCVTPLHQSYLGVLIEGFTLTLSPTLMQIGWFFMARSETGKKCQLI